MIGASHDRESSNFFSVTYAHEFIYYQFAFQMVATFTRYMPYPFENNLFL